MQVNKPSCVFVRFVHEIPRKFVLTNERGEIEYMRYLNGKTPRIKFNILRPGTYHSLTPFEVVKMGPVEYPEVLPELPEHEREGRFKQFQFVDNFSLSGTPARIFTQTGQIELSREFYDMPPEIQKFIKLHEIGHFFYSTEEKCDLFALYHFLKQGGNRSMAFYALSHVLKRTPENLKRLESLLYNIQKTQSNKL